FDCLHSSLRCGFKDRGLDFWSVYGGTDVVCGLSPFAMPPQAAMLCFPLSNAPDTLIQASIKRSTSDSVVLQPRLRRMAPRASAGATPIVASTCDGWTLPDEHAAPEETATPSRSKAITAVSAFMPGRPTS